MFFFHVAEVYFVVSTLVSTLSCLAQALAGDILFCSWVRHLLLWFPCLLGCINGLAYETLVVTL